jgi:hypothetical protein
VLEDFQTVSEGEFSKVTCEKLSACRILHRSPEYRRAPARCLGAK